MAVLHFYFVLYILRTNRVVARPELLKWQTQVL